MMDRKTDRLASAIGDMDTAYLEEALDYGSAKAGHRKLHRFPKLSAAVVAVLVILGLSVTAFAISRIPLSWRDIFSPGQTVVSDEDEVPVVSQLQQPEQQAAPTEEMQIKIEKVISDERILYLLYSVKANDGAVLDQKGNFYSFDLYFPGQMMTGVYMPYFLERKEGVPENELEGVLYANWQAGASANGLVLDISNWQEKKWFEDVRVDFNVAEMVENAGENARLPKLFDGRLPQYRHWFANDPLIEYLWQPGDADIPLPYGGLSICNAGWENGVLQMVMKGPVNQNISYPENWYFVDTRTDTIIYPESEVNFRTPDIVDPNVTDTDWNYIWEFVLVDKETLPYLELHWGGKDIFTTVLPGHWRVTLEETPVTIESEVLAENVPLSYGGKNFLAEKVECSKLSIAFYLTEYADPTERMYRHFKAFDASGDLIPFTWNSLAAADGESSMIWAQFDEPIEPETVCKLTFNGETVFER